MTDICGHLIKSNADYPRINQNLHRCGRHTTRRTIAYDPAPVAYDPAGNGIRPCGAQGRMINFSARMLDPGHSGAVS